MSAGERYVVLGLARARSPWFAEVGRWSTAAALPVEFVKCVSVEELRARLGSGRAFSALLVDGGLPGVDRDLLDKAREGGCAAVVVDDERARRNWVGLGASAVLGPTFTRTELLDALGTHAAAIPRGTAAVAEAGWWDSTPTGWQAPVIAVLGVGGAGTSTVAAAAAQGLGDDPRYAGSVLLADLALDAHQAVLHDAGDVVPGLPELVDAHRLGQPTVEEVRSLTGHVDRRGYDLLLGLRRRRDWAALRPRAVEAALAGLRRAYGLVVADLTNDLDGEAQCGSSDVEDRNHLARSTTAAATLVLVVGQPGPTRVHALVRLLGAVLDHGVEPERVVTIVNRAPRNPRARAELTRAVAELLAPMTGTDRMASPLYLPDRRGVDDLVHDGQRLPGALAHPLASVVVARLDAVPALVPASATMTVSASEPVAVVPGSLGSWSDPR